MAQILLSAMFAGHAVDEVIHHSEIVEQVLLQHYDKQTEEAIDSLGQCDYIEMRVFSDSQWEFSVYDLATAVARI